MPRTCTSVRPGTSITCQDGEHPEGRHHAHVDGDCLTWEGGLTASRPVDSCQYLPAADAEARAQQYAAKAEALRTDRMVAAFKDDLIDRRVLEAYLQGLRDADRMREARDGERVGLRLPGEVLQPVRPDVPGTVQWQVHCPVCAVPEIERENAMGGSEPRSEVNTFVRCAAGHSFHIVVSHHKGAEYITIAP